ncbi:purine-cytosine permease family protein [Peribacillus butanolivorans]|uniref:purine-cytosine permease family protein n=1 Tax=Peribacillus butanolivorans TaxID=421767 RepID=UPI003664073C
MGKKYHQPKGVEQYGIEQIPDEERNVKWYDIFLMVVNFLMNPGMILLGGLSVAAGLSFWAGITAIVSGVAVAFIAYIVMATIGVDYGVPGTVATRMVFGIKGSKYTVSVFRAITAVYWFAVQTLAGAAAITVIIKNLFGVSLSIVTVSLIFAIFQILIATFGYDSLKILSRFAFPIKIFGLLFVLYALMTHDDPNYHISNVFGYEGTLGWKWGVFIVWVNTLAGVWLSMVTDAADFCRYSRTRKDMWIGTLLAAIVGTFISAFIGAYSAAATLGKIPNGLEGAASIVTSEVGLLIILLVIVLDNWTINVLNLYTGALSVVNFAPKLGRFWATIIVSVIGVALSLFPALLDKLMDTMNYSGNVFAPLAAVLICDYVVIKQGKLVVNHLYEEHGIYRYAGGWNVSALVWTLLGFFIYYLIPVMYFQSAICFVLTGIGYYVTQRLTGQVIVDQYNIKQITS